MEPYCQPRISSTCLTPPPPPAESQNWRNEYKELREERDDLHKQLTDFQKEFNEKVDMLDYYWQKSKDMENKSTAIEVLLDLKSKDLALARQELEKKAGEPESPPGDLKNYLTKTEYEQKLEQDTAYYKYHLEETSRKELELQMRCLRYEETVQDLTSHLAIATSSSKQTEEVISKLDKESREAKECLKILTAELTEERMEYRRRQALMVVAADQIVDRDIQIKLLKQENSQLNGQLQVLSEERSCFGQIIEGFRAKFGVEVGQGASVAQLFAILADFVSNQFTTLDQFSSNTQRRSFAREEVPLPTTVDLCSTLSPPEVDMDTRKKRRCFKNEEDVPRKVVKSDVARGSGVTGVFPGLTSCNPPVVQIDCRDTEEDSVVNVEN